MKIENIKYIWILGVLFWFSLCVSKNDILNVYRKALPYREASLISGIILGDKDFDKQFNTELKNSGLVHLVVVSGGVVVLLIGGLIELMASEIGRKVAIGMGLIVSIKYLFLVGFEIPVIRATLLLLIFYLAQILGRKFDVWRALIAIFIIMVLADYRVVLNVGFWMSFAAYVGVISCPWKNNLVKIFWINLWLAPIMLLVFEKISWITILTNLLVIGMIEVVTIIGAVFGLIGLVWFEFGKIGLWLVLPMLKYLAVVVEIGGKVKPMGMNINWLVMIGFYLGLTYVSIKNKNSTHN